MATVNLTMSELESTLKNNDIVIIDFWASWCGPCKMFAPVYEKASENNKDIVFAKVDTEKEQQLAAAFGIQSIPTLAIFRENILLYKQPGALPDQALDDLIAQVKNLDMEQVKEQVKQTEEEKASA